MTKENSVVEINDRINRTSKLKESKNIWEPPTLEERVNPNMECGLYLNKIKFCFGTFQALKKKIWAGDFRKDCDKLDDILKNCLDYKFTGDLNAKKRFYELNRRIYHNVTELPWEPNEKYINYLEKEKRLPKVLRIKYNFISSETDDDLDEILKNEDTKVEKS
jgi:hypothetical protein